MASKSRRFFPWLLAAIFFITSIWFAWPRVELLRAEWEINGLYRTFRPFGFRWKGAPYTSPAAAGRPVPLDVLRPAMAILAGAEARQGRTAQSLRLRGRLALLAGLYDDAIVAYQIGGLLDPKRFSFSLELGAALALRATGEGTALDYDLALQSMLEAEKNDKAPEAPFDIALLCEQIPLPYQAIEHWREAAAGDRLPEWRKEAELHLAAIERHHLLRAQQVRELTESPESYLAHAANAGESLELVVETALESWLPQVRLPASQEALRRVAQALEADRRDRWLSELLQIPASPARDQAFDALSRALRSNAAGNHAEAGQLASEAETKFRRIGSPAGWMRARMEHVYSLDRRNQPAACLSALEGLRAAAVSRSYVWIAGQAWLEEITCQTQARSRDVIASREQAYLWISETGYTALRLRALGFLTESISSFGSRAHIWKRCREGLQLYWSSAQPALRGYGFPYAMASAARSAGESEAAVLLMRESARILDDARYRQLLALILSNLGGAELDAGMPASSAETLDRAARLFETLDPRETEGFRTEAEILRAHAEISGDQVPAGLSRMQRIAVSHPYPYSDLTPVVRRRLLPTFGDAYMKSGDLENARRHYQLAIAETTEKLKAVRSRAQRDNAYHEMETAWRGAVEIQIRRGDPRGALELWEQFRGARVGQASRQSLQIPIGTVLAVYAFLPGGLSAWMIDRRGVEQHWLPFEARAAAEDFTARAADPDIPLSVVSKSSRRLYRLLFGVFERVLPADGNLIVDADGPLAQIPWRALEDAAGQYLGARFAISQASGWASIAMGLRSGIVDLRYPLIVAEPTIKPSLLSSFPPLPEARMEAWRLRNRLPGATFIEGANATVEAFTSAAQRASSVHFAGHGVANGGLGALLMAPSPEDSVAARLLTAEQISRLHLQQVGLVVISSCAAGVGERSGAVNLDSLVASFLESGAASVVAARWNVESRSTQRLMEEFYDGILAGRRPAAALQRAETRLRADPATAHPYYWAAFEVFGAP